MRGEQREGVGADRIEGDIAEIEQAREADHDVQAPAEHHVGQHQDGEVEPVAQRQPELEGLVYEIGGDGKEQREYDARDGEDMRIRQVRPKPDDQPAQKTDRQERHDRAGDQLGAGGGDEQKNAERDKTDDAERDQLVAVDRLAT